MPQAFRPQHVLFIKLASIAAAMTLMVGAWASWYYAGVSQPRAKVAPTAPIPFSHKHHVGDDGLDCRMCHVNVERSASPGMPSAQVCLTCHSQLFADQGIFDPLRRSAASGKPIAWEHINRLPDYVYFDHSVHIARNIACVECHGRVDQMPLFQRSAPMTMRWCIGCHEAPASRRVTPGQEFSMTPTPATSVAGHADAVAALLPLEPTRRLTDCSTCHR